MRKGKEEMRRELASLSFADKIRILEKLRDRDRAIAACGLRRTASNNGPDRRTDDL